VTKSAGHRMSHIYRLTLGILNLLYAFKILVLTIERVLAGHPTKRLPERLSYNSIIIYKKIFSGMF
jgi:hypothetical protein